MTSTPSSRFFEQLEIRAPGFAQRLLDIVTPERAFAVFRQIADTYAPSLTVGHTRAPVLARQLQAAREEGILDDSVDFECNHRQAGVAAAFLGARASIRTWSVTHLDNISYLTEPRQEAGYPLTPFCQSRQTHGSRPGLALSFDTANGQAAVLAEGELITGSEGPGGLEPVHFFKTDAKDLPLATRVCYATAAEWDRETDMVYGCIDNAACCAAQLLAVLVTAPYKPDVMALWPDEEEGVVDMGPPSFSRASLRLVHRTPPHLLPNLIFVSDIQDLLLAEGVDPRDPVYFGHGASMEGYASRTRGAVTPPRLQTAMRSLVQGMQALDVRVRETGRYVNRGDDVALVMATPNIAFLSCPGAFTHFQETPRASILDIMHLAKALAVSWMAAQNPEWTDQFSR